MHVYDHVLECANYAWHRFRNAYSGSYWFYLACDDVGLGNLETSMIWFIIYVIIGILTTYKLFQEMHDDTITNCFLGLIWPITLLLWLIIALLLSGGK